MTHSRVVVVTQVQMSSTRLLGNMLENMAGEHLPS